MPLKRLALRRFLLVAGDLLVLFLCLQAAFVLRYHRPLFSLGAGASLVVVLCTLAFGLASFYVFDLYDIRLEYRTVRFVIAFLESLVLLALLTLGVFLVCPLEAWKKIFPLDMALKAGAVFLWRLCFSLLLKWTAPQRNILVVGSRGQAESVRAVLSKFPEYRIRAVLIHSHAGKTPLSEAGLKKDAARLKRLARQKDIQDVVLASPSPGPCPVDSALVELKMRGVNVYDMMTLYEAFLFKVPASYIEKRWIFESRGFQRLNSRTFERTKRLLDILTAGTLLVLLAPLGAVAAAAVALGSRGPVFYVQERVGKNGRPFRLIKFRTMVRDAERRGARWAQENDPRVTAVGKWLRKIRVDEWPQLWNVLRGEMSVIGPRPERKCFTRKLSRANPVYSLRFALKPGLTGWAQVHYRYAASEGDALEKLEYELYYLKNMSFVLDILIMLKTVKIVLFRSGR